MRIWLSVLALLVLAGCTESVSRNANARVLMMGDSMFAIHGASRKSVAHQLEARLGEPVVDRSVSGAQYLYALPISGSLGLRIGRQYQASDWDWVIVNGGGNDLWLTCGCRACNAKLDRLISADGKTGEIVDVVSTARAGGAKVVYAGYLRTPGVPSSIDHCKAYGDALEARLARMAARDGGIWFVSMADLVPNGDRSFHGPDLIHPSHKGSAAIAARIAAAIKAAT
nr:SGNH/GDSL hydrolase family protein [uncultured Tateyamaria sp.]